MKIIDKTPLQDADGNISMIARVQGTLKYGLSWFGELEAQKTVIAQLDRSLEKGFVLIRNFTLPNIEVVLPLILIGPGGISVIYVTQVKGRFEAKGDQWNIINNDGKSLPANSNLLDIVTKRARALQRYLQEQKINLPNPIEPVLIAADPGAQIESVRPIVRVVRSDAIKQFASALLQARPVWRTDFIHDLSDRLINPRPPAELEPVEPPVSEQENSFDTNDLGFAFEEGGAQPVSENLREPDPARPLARPKPAPGKGKFLGLGNTQIVLLAGMFIVECCILGFGIILLTLNQ